MKEFSKSISISFKKEDRIYGEMIEAVAAFYQSMGDLDRGNVSRLVVRLIKNNVLQMIGEIEEKHGVNPLDIYKEFNKSKVSRNTFFSKRINRRDLADDYVKNKFDEVYEKDERK